MSNTSKYLRTHQTHPNRCYCLQRHPTVNHQRIPLPWFVHRWLSRTSLQLWKTKKTKKECNNNNEMMFKWHATFWLAICMSEPDGKLYIYCNFRKCHHSSSFRVLTLVFGVSADRPTMILRYSPSWADAYLSIAVHLFDGFLSTCSRIASMRFVTLLYFAIDYHVMDILYLVGEAMLTCTCITQWLSWLHYSFPGGSWRHFQHKISGWEFGELRAATFSDWTLENTFVYLMVLGSEQMCSNQTSNVRSVWHTSETEDRSVNFEVKVFRNVHLMDGWLMCGMRLMTNERIFWICYEIWARFH